MPYLKNISLGDTDKGTQNATVLIKTNTSGDPEAADKFMRTLEVKCRKKVSPFPVIWT